ncbi:MAG: ParA family protein [Clostridia bacterium]|nr:ParA family protein [Clostridia bacterium]
MLISFFCKKGGVGKTTVTGEFAGYLTSLGKRVLIISIDDQNSVFEMFGRSSAVFEDDSNYLEHYVAGACEQERVLIPMRDNLYAVKTLNTDMLSKKLTLERTFERQFTAAIDRLQGSFDFTFFDLPPSSNRTTEILLEKTDLLMLIVELNKLGVNGFYNTLQYFVDNDIELEKIRYVLPNSYSKTKSAPGVALGELKALIAENVPHTRLLPLMPEKSLFQSLQQKGVILFDDPASEYAKRLSNYEYRQKKNVMEIMSAVFDSIEFT